MNKKLVCLLACGFAGIWSEVNCAAVKLGSRLGSTEKKNDTELIQQAFNWVKQHGPKLVKMLQDNKISLLLKKDLINYVVKSTLENNHKDMFLAFSDKQQDYIMGVLQAMINVEQSPEKVEATLAKMKKIYGQKQALKKKLDEENAYSRIQGRAQKRTEFEQSVPKLLELLKEVEAEKQFQNDLQPKNKAKRKAQSEVTNEPTPIEEPTSSVAAKARTKVRGGTEDVPLTENEINGILNYAEANGIDQFSSAMFRNALATLGMSTKKAHSENLNKINIELQNRYVPGTIKKVLSHQDIVNKNAARGYEEIPN